MRVFLGAVLAFVAAFVLAYVIVVAGAFGFMLVNNIHDRDGGIAMGLMFGLGPLCALFVGVVAAFITHRKLGRHQRARDAGASQPLKPWPLSVLVAAPALTGAGAYVALWAFIRTIGPPRFDSYGKAMTFWLATVAFALAVAALVFWRGWRRRRHAAVQQDITSR